MFESKTNRVEVTCERCGQTGSISWEEEPPIDPNAEPRIGAVSLSGFYQQPGLGAPAVFCSNCGTMKVPLG
jgi:hypothetical protein